jgi:uncharacterized membrane protein
MPLLSQLHVFFAIGALTLAAAVLLTPKGTRRDRKIGLAYVVAASVAPRGISQLRSEATDVKREVNSLFSQQQ